MTKYKEIVENVREAIENFDAGKSQLSDGSDIEYKDNPYYLIGWIRGTVKKR